MSTRPVSTFRKIAAISLAAAFLLAGCGGGNRPDATPPLQLPAPLAPSGTAGAASAPATSQALNLGGGRSAPRRAPEIILGRDSAPPFTLKKSAAVSEQEGAYTLNFENASIRDTVKAVLGDILGLNYDIDPAVQGTTTIHTAEPLPRAAVLPAIEAALRLSGVALIARDGGYDVIPMQDAPRHVGAMAGASASQPGFRVEIVPIRFVAAAEIQRVLEPMVQPGTILRVDPERNLVVLAGTESDLAALIDTISIFDVDWMKSENFALYPLRYAPARSVAAELGQVIGQEPLAGVVRIVPINRLNAILVVSKQRAYLEELRGWIDRFDRGDDTDAPRFFVYHVQNGRATDLAQVLGRILGHGGSGASEAAAPLDIHPPPEPLPTAGAAAGGTAPQAAPAPMPADPGSSGGGFSSLTIGDVRITADDTNNALIVMASPDRYKVIESALRQLDTVPLQVLLEAVVVEVTLTNDLQYGVQYFVKSGEVSLLRSSEPPSSLGLSPGGFSFLFSHGTSISAVLDLLSTVTQLRVVSAPEVMVLNNRTAMIQVGDEVPIATASAVSVQVPGAPVVNNIQMRDTGVILHVTPRVNQGGMVMLEIGQEVSQSVPTTTSSIDSPTIQERRLSSTVAVEDGQTVALGGLISDSRTKTKTGIPGLRDIPVVGNIFGDTTDNVTRTELLVLITPHVIRDRRTADEATEELREKLPLIRSLDAH